MSPLYLADEYGDIGFLPRPPGGIADPFPRSPVISPCHCHSFLNVLFPLFKCELYHWVDLLDRFDGILADAGQTVENMSWMLVCDRPEREQLKSLLLSVLNFTALLIEYSFSRHLYSSIEVKNSKVAGLGFRKAEGPLI